MLCALTRCCSHRGRSRTHPQTDGHQSHRCKLRGEGGEEAFVDHCLGPPPYLKIHTLHTHACIVVVQEYHTTLRVTHVLECTLSMYLSPTHFYRHCRGGGTNGTEQRGLRAVLAQHLPDVATPTRCCSRQNSSRTPHWHRCCLLQCRLEGGEGRGVCTGCGHGCNTDNQARLSSQAQAILVLATIPLWQVLYGGESALPWKQTEQDRAMCCAHSPGVAAIGAGPGLTPGRMDTSRIGASYRGREGMQCLAAVACHGHFNIHEGQNISVLMTAPSLHELQQEEDRDEHQHCHFIPKGTRPLSNTYVPCVAAVRTVPGRPTGIGAATFSAGWGGEGKVKI